MASVKMPIEINLPDNWAEIVAEKLKESGDYVPVVRCKDCNFWRRCGETNKGECDGLEIYGSMKEDDFCSYGERKEK